MSAIVSEKDYLTLLGKAKRKRRNLLIETATKREVNAISEIVNNVLRENIQIKATEIAKLRRHRKQLRLIASRSVPIKDKKVLIKQTGGFLATLIPIALSVLSSVIPALFKKKKRP